MPKKKTNTNIAKQQPKKRAFSTLELEADSKEPKALTRAKKKNPEPINEPKQYFFNISEYLIEKIFSFLHNNMYSRLKLVNKEFHKIVSRLFTNFDFEDKPYIPVDILQTIMQNSGKPEFLIFGYLKNFTADVFLKTIVPPLNLKCLNILNFEKFNELSDDILLKCLKKTNFSNLNCLLLPYNSRITNKSLDFIERNFKNLDFFSLQSKSLDFKEKHFKQKTLANIFKNNECLIEFAVEALTDEFFENIVGFESFSLNVFKVRNLHLQEISKIDTLLIIGKAFPYLHTFFLKEIYLKKRMVNESRHEINDFFNNLMRNLHFLEILKLGHFTTMSILNVLSVRAKNLEYFKVESENLAIPEVQIFFFECMKLEKVSGCVGRDCSSVFTFTKEFDYFHCQLNINLEIDLMAHF